MLGSYKWELVTKPCDDGVVLIMLTSAWAGELFNNGLVRAICTFDDATTQELSGDVHQRDGAWRIEIKGRQLIGVYLECRPKK